ncbi:MAG TPA: hypothetical protein VMP11_21290 [Verrucomicrobiae bacterium]|nr:hypothetical protein [Verrucomicrobiae bacterium]
MIDDLPIGCRDYRMGVNPERIRGKLGNRHSWMGPEGGGTEAASWPSSDAKHEFHAIVGKAKAIALAEAFR